MKPTQRLLLPILLLLTTSLAASELWITPAVDPPDMEVGDWAVTSTGQTHFSFAVPGDYAGLIGAKVVVIGKNDKRTSYDLSLSVSQKAYPYDEWVAAFSGDTAFVRDELAEVDVSSVFPEDLAPGLDYVSLYFNTNFARVLGLRFQYENLDLGLLREDLEVETHDRIQNDREIRADVSAETSSRIAGDEAEAAFRESADRAIRLDLTAEQSARIAADEAEAYAREYVDNVLRDGLTLETTERKAGDFNIQTALNNEIAARSDGDGILQAQIDAYSCPACPACPEFPSPRTFYLTSDTYRGDQVLTACADGYRVADTFDLARIDDLEYADGMGEPEGIAFWFGGYSRGWFFDAQPGFTVVDGDMLPYYPNEYVNCANWTNPDTLALTFKISNGFYHALDGFFLSQAFTYDIQYSDCDVPLRVWCASE